jgi:hypothetical protein
MFVKNTDNERRGTIKKELRNSSVFDISLMTSYEKREIVNIPIIRMTDEYKSVFE